MRLPSLIVASAFLLSAAPAAAQTGASDDRLSLPEGAGSLEGLGENVSIDTNMGAMQHSVGFTVPAGFPATTPGLSLSYNSGGGASVVGIGWSFAVPNIERMTYRRLPRYTRDDDFAANGGDQLVQLPGSDPPVYRSRYEGGFMRYTWHAAGDGTEGYWECESPVGVRMFYGATSDGVLVDNARVSGPDGTFRYMLVETVDLYDHRMVYSYIKDGPVSLLSHVGYVFADGDTPTYEVRLGYEARRDNTGAEFLSDAKAGFDELLTQRLREVTVHSRRQQIRSYLLHYDRYADSGGFTRLTRVEQYGAEGGLFPVVQGFEYSNGLGGLCQDDDCGRPYVESMGTLGLNLASGSATLLDINGDALPDLLDTTQDGAHRLYINRPDMAGRSRFDTDPVLSRVGTRASHDLAAARVQVLDTDGDGFTDLVNSGTGEVLRNRGGGDWEGMTDDSDTQALADALGDDAQFENLRFLDYNGDKLIDVIRSNGDSTTVLRNGGPDGFIVDESVDNIGAGFAEDGLQFADMNGDGLLDVVRVQPQTILYRLNYGWGKWGPWVTVENLPIDEVQIDVAELEDINGDGLADVVVVAADSVTYALNQNGASFAAALTVDSNTVEGDIPLRDGGTTVLYADMNGNGSSDIVWFSPQGEVRYLELFPIRPNLLSRLTNGIGKVAEISYTSTVTLMARDGGTDAWAYRLPFPNNVVTSVSEYDLTDPEAQEVTSYIYRDGYYDGVEKAFRGFERVESFGAGDEFQEEGRVELLYEIGVDDIYRKGLLLRVETFSADRSLNESFTEYGDCDVAGIPEGTEFPIRYICSLATERVIKEGRPEAEWVRTRQETTYDGYGNMTLSADLGVVSVGDGPCEPCDRPEGEFGEYCGAQCLGDETYTETEYASPDNTGGRWILGSAWRVRSYGRPGSDLFQEKHIYYDGEPFVGLPSGQLTLSQVSRMTQKVEADSDRVIETERYAYDAHGNVVEKLDALGVPGGTTHREATAYDPDGLRVVRADKFTETPEGEPYQLRRESTYEPLFDKLASGTSWRVARSESVSPQRATAYFYDEHGRLSRRFLPADGQGDAASEEFTYELQSPVSRITAVRRSRSGAEPDLVSIQCIDGRGRTIQKRSRVADGEYHVVGFTTYNIQSKPLRTYQPYTSDSPACDPTPPEGLRYLQMRYDASFRPLRTVEPDADLYGTASYESTEYLPLAMVVSDSEDNNPDGPHAGTTTTTRSNGLGWTTRIERILNVGDAPHITRSHYDELGRPVGYTDAGDHRKDQEQDLLDRVTTVIDPNTGGELTMEYDDAGNSVRTMDERGVVTIAEYDGLNRLRRQYDEDDPDGTLIEQTYDIVRDCDPALCTYPENTLVEMSYPGLNGERAYDFHGLDERSRMVYTARRIAGVTFETRTEYDNADRTTAVTYPDGSVISREYDGLSRPVAIEGVLDRIVYDDRGRLSRTDTAHGVTTVMKYDGRMRLSEVHAQAGDTTLQGLRYARDRVGHIVSVEDLGGSQGVPSFDAAYTYDSWYRLTEASLNPGSEDAEALTYAYNPIHNLVSRTSTLDGSPVDTGVHTYGDDRPNAVQSIDGVEMEYDLSGHLLARGPMDMAWDFRGRMTSATTPSARADYVYDAGQGRVAATRGDSTSLYLAPDFIVRDGIVELFVALDSRRVAKIESDALATTVLSDLAVDGQDPDGQINAGDAWLSAAGAEAADPAGALLAASTRRLLFETGPADGMTWFHQEQLGSLTMATVAGPDGPAVAGQRRFYPFGHVRALSGDVSEFGFTGKEMEPDSDLLYFGNRYYDPWMARWLSIDPAFTTISSEGVTTEGTVAYAYVTNDPLNAVDPDGLEKVALFMGLEGAHLGSGPHRDDYVAESWGHYGRDSSYRKRVMATKHSRGGLRGVDLSEQASVLTVVGHTDGPSGRFGTHAFTVSPTELADRLIAEGLKPGSYSGLTIELQGCISATSGKSWYGMKKKSFAEQFTLAMSRKGFSDVKVMGYHGFVGSDRSLGTVWQWEEGPGSSDAEGTPRSSKMYGATMDSKFWRTEFTMRRSKRLKSHKTSAKGPTSKMATIKDTLKKGKWHKWKSSKKRVQWTVKKTEL